MKRAGSKSVSKGGPLKTGQKSGSAHHSTQKAQTKKPTGKGAAPVEVNNFRNFKKQKSIEDDTTENTIVTATMVPWLKREKPISLRGRFKDIDSLSSIVNAALKGVSPDFFYEFAKLIDMPDKYLAEMINTSPRTISNYKALNKNLEPPKGEHLLKVVSLFEKGEETLGNFYEFHGWLFKPQSYGIKMPATFLVTPGGVDLISQELDRAAYGYAL